MSSFIKETIIYFIILQKKPQHSILKLMDIFVYLNLNLFTIFPKRDSLLSSDTRLLLLSFSSLFSELISCLSLLICAELFNISFNAVCPNYLLFISCSLSSILFAEILKMSLSEPSLLFSASSLFTKLIFCFSLFSCAGMFKLSLLASEYFLFSICFSLSELFAKFFLALVKTSEVSLESHRTCRYPTTSRNLAIFSIDFGNRLKTKHHQIRI